mmetsp:Transcript_79802/g.222148  ORF Transcript_79802/g.222148 Transcript_79802/m.222148 type:complete len:255 (+) Transcript_79802:565-1329(+)
MARGRSDLPKHIVRRQVPVSGSVMFREVLCPAAEVPRLIRRDADPLVEERRWRRRAALAVARSEARDGVPHEVHGVALRMADSVQHRFHAAALHAALPNSGHFHGARRRVWHPRRFNAALSVVRCDDGQLPGLPLLRNHGGALRLGEGAGREQHVDRRGLQRRPRRWLLGLGDPHGFDATGVHATMRTSARRRIVAMPITRAIVTKDRCGGAPSVCHGAGNDTPRLASPERHPAEGLAAVAPQASDIALGRRGD